MLELRLVATYCDFCHRYKACAVVSDAHEAHICDECTQEVIHFLDVKSRPEVSPCP